jgi:hypothetical protein
MSVPPSVVSVHTPTTSFAIIHKRAHLVPLSISSCLTFGTVAEETLTSLFDKLSRKHNTDFYGKRVGPGWLKYEWNGTIWGLDDGSSASPDVSFEHAPLTDRRLGLHNIHLAARGTA